MWKLVLYEIKHRITYKFIGIWLIFLVTPLCIANLRKSNYSFRDPLDFYIYSLEGVFQLIFPLVAVLVYVPLFSQEIKNRFLVYTRLRDQVRRTLLIRILANMVLTFSTFFLIIFSLFLFAFYIAPGLGIVTFHPENYMLDSTSVVVDSYFRVTFSQLLKYGPFIYGLTYSIWIACNAVIYSLLSFYSVILTKNRLLALSIPFLVYFIGTLVLGTLKLDRFRPAYTIFPFGYVQSPIWTAFIPLIVLVCIIVFLHLYILKNTDKLESLA